MQFTSILLTEIERYMTTLWALEDKILVFWSPYRIYLSGYNNILRNISLITNLQKTMWSNFRTQFIGSDEMNRINEISLKSFNEIKKECDEISSKCFIEVLFDYVRQMANVKEVHELLVNNKFYHSEITLHDYFMKFGGDWLLFIANFKDEVVGKQIIEKILKQFVDTPSERAIKLGYKYAQFMADDLTITYDISLQMVIDGINYPFDGTDIFADNEENGIQDWFFPLGIDKQAQQIYYEWFNSEEHSIDMIEENDRYSNEVKEITYRWLVEQYEAGSIESEGAMLFGPYDTLEDFERAFKAEDDDFPVILEGQYEQGVRYIGTEIDSNEDDTFRMQSLPSVTIQWCDGTKWHLFKLEK